SVARKSCFVVTLGRFFRSLGAGVAAVASAGWVSGAVAAAGLESAGLGVALGLSRAKAAEARGGKMGLGEFMAGKGRSGLGGERRVVWVGNYTAHRGRMSKCSTDLAIDFPGTGAKVSGRCNICPAATPGRWAPDS